MSNPFKEMETQLRVTTRTGAPMHFAVTETVAREAMKGILEERTGLIFAHSGGVAYINCADIVSLNIHGQNIPHAETILTDILTTGK